eukprot:1702950-Ditylum_brightwellii.AAC.1
MLPSKAPTVILAHVASITPQTDESADPEEAENDSAKSEVVDNVEETTNPHGYLPAKYSQTAGSSLSKPISKVFFEQLHESAKAPYRATPGSAGYKITALEGAVIPA